MIWYERSFVYCLYNAEDFYFCEQMKEVLFLMEHEMF